MAARNVAFPPQRDPYKRIYPESVNVRPHVLIALWIVLLLLCLPATRYYFQPRASARMDTADRSFEAAQTRYERMKMQRSRCARIAEMIVDADQPTLEALNESWRANGCERPTAQVEAAAK